MDMRKCKTCGNEFEPERKTKVYCSDECRYHNWLANKKRVTIPRDMRFSILMRDGFACRYCGDKPPQKQLVVDHVTSIEDGGARTDFDNLVTACIPCNSGKGKRSLDIKDVPLAPEA